MSKNWGAWHLYNALKQCRNPQLGLLQSICYPHDLTWDSSRRLLLSKGYYTLSFFSNHEMSWYLFSLMIPLFKCSYYLITITHQNLLNIFILLKKVGESLKIKGNLYKISGIPMKRRAWNIYHWNFRVLSYNKSMNFSSQLLSKKDLFLKGYI